MSVVTKKPKSAKAKKPKSKPKSTAKQPAPAKKPSAATAAEAPKPSRNLKPIELRRNREHGRGNSPFSTPSVGDVLQAKGGLLREVVLYHAEAGSPITYVSLAPGSTIVKPCELPITRSAWAAWCSRSSALLLGRSMLGHLRNLANSRRTTIAESASAAGGGGGSVDG